MALNPQRWVVKTYQVLFQIFTPAEVTESEIAISQFRKFHMEMVQPQLSWLSFLSPPRNET